MNFLKKKKARAQRARTKKRGHFRQKRASFCLGIQKTWQLKVVLCLCPCFQFSLILVFFCWSLDDRLLKIWPRAWKTWHRMQATDSHRQPYAATGSHKPRKIIKSGLLMGPGCQDAAPKPIHSNPLETTCGPRGWARGGCCSSWGPLPFNFAYSWALADKVQALSKPT